jgi:hypothetical protein
MRVFTAFLKPDHAATTITTFAAWMAKYPGLVGQLELDMPYSVKNIEGYLGILAQQKLCRKVESAMCSAFTSSTAAAASAAAAARPRLALKAFGCDLYRDPNILKHCRHHLQASTWGTWWTTTLLLVHTATHHSTSPALQLR